MGAVYAAETLEGARVAIKLLTLGADPESFERFRREAEAHARVDRHPNVARIHSGGIHEGQAFLVMDLLPGGDLHDRLRVNALPPDEVRALGIELAAGLAHVHAQGVLHRDIKPANVLFDEGGHPRLTDFGLARQVEATSLTQSGVLLGTPGFMAPEQAGEGGTTEATDVFGLGATLYAALARQPPFTGASLLQTLDNLLNEPPPPLPTFVPDDLRRAIFRALEKDPADRFQDAKSFQAALRERGSPLRRSPVWLGVALTLALLLSLGAGLAVAFPSRASPTPAPTRSSRPSRAPSLAPTVTRRAPHDWSPHAISVLSPGEDPRAIKKPNSVTAAWLGPQRFATVADNGIIQIWEPNEAGLPQLVLPRQALAAGAREGVSCSLGAKGWLAWGSYGRPFQFLKLAGHSPPLEVRGPRFPSFAHSLSGGSYLLLSQTTISLWRPNRLEQVAWSRELKPPTPDTDLLNAVHVLEQGGEGKFELLLAWSPSAREQATTIKPQIQRARVGAKGFEELWARRTANRPRSLLAWGDEFYMGDNTGGITIWSYPDLETELGSLQRPSGAMPTRGAHAAATVRDLALGPNRTLLSLGAIPPGLRAWDEQHNPVAHWDLVKKIKRARRLAPSPDRRHVLVSGIGKVILIPTAARTRR